MKTRFAQILLAVAFLPHSHNSQTGAAESDQVDRNTIIASNHLGRASLAYQSAVVQMMLAEANYHARKLNLPTTHPIQITNIKSYYASPPIFSIEGGNMGSLTNKQRPARFVVSGNLETTNLSFYFRDGRLWTVGNHLKYDEHAPSLTDTNGAYLLAKKWLTEAGVDVKTLEIKYKHKVVQRWYLPGRVGPAGETNLDVHYVSTGDTNRIMLPTFTAMWGSSFDTPASTQGPAGQTMRKGEEEWEGDAATVRILGTTKELMELHLADLSLSRRPELVITNAVELSNTPDPKVNNRLRHTPPAIQTNTP